MLFSWVHLFFWLLPLRIDYNHFSSIYSMFNFVLYDCFIYIFIKIFLVTVSYLNLNLTHCKILWEHHLTCVMSCQIICNDCLCPLLYMRIPRILLLFSFEYINFVIYFNIIDSNIVIYICFYLTFRPVMKKKVVEPVRRSPRISQERASNQFEMITLPDLRIYPADVRQCMHFFCFHTC